MRVKSVSPKNNNVIKLLTLNDLESDMLTTGPPIGSSETQALN